MEKKEFDSESAYNGKYLKAKTKSYFKLQNFTTLKYQKKVLNVFVYE